MFKSCFRLVDELSRRKWNEESVMDRSVMVMEEEMGRRVLHYRELRLRKCHSLLYLDVMKRVCYRRVHSDTPHQIFENP